MAITTPVYCTREDVKNALDLKETARSNAAIDLAIRAATDSVEALCHRHFYPQLATKYFDWPDQYARSWRLWLDEAELISLSSLSSGGVTIPPSNYLLEPNRTGPPYNRIEINISSSSAFGGGATTQRDITAVGLFGHSNTEAPAGTGAAAANSAATSIDVSDSSAIGVGQILRIGTERLIVAERSMKTTGQTLQTPIDAQQKTVIVAVTNGSLFAVGEVLLLDAERMLIVDIAGNNLIVKRAWDGSVLAAHTGSTIYASRTLTVVRGALGTTAAAMAQGDPIVAWQAPGLVRQLATAEAVVDLLRASSGYAAQTGVGSQSRTVGGGQAVRTAPGVGIGDLRDQVYAALGRKARTRAV